MASLRLKYLESCTAVLNVERKDKVNFCFVFGFCWGFYCLVVGFFFPAKDK